MKCSVFGEATVGKAAALCSSFGSVRFEDITCCIICIYNNIFLSETQARGLSFPSGPLTIYGGLKKNIRSKYYRYRTVQEER